MRQGDAEVRLKFFVSCGLFVYNCETAEDEYQIK